MQGQGLRSYDIFFFCVNAEWGSYSRSWKEAKNCMVPCTLNEMLNDVGRFVSFQMQCNNLNKPLHSCLESLGEKIQGNSGFGW